MHILAEPKNTSARSKKATEIAQKVYDRFNRCRHPHQMLIVSERTNNEELAAIMSPLHFYCHNPRCRRKVSPNLVALDKNYLHLCFICHHCKHHACLWTWLGDSTKAISLLSKMRKDSIPQEGQWWHKEWGKIFDKVFWRNLGDEIEKELKKLKKNKKS